MYSKCQEEALRKRNQVQAIVAHHEVHPNSVNTRKPQATDRLVGLISGDAKARSEHVATAWKPYAKIGGLTVEQDFFCAG